MPVLAGPHHPQGAQLELLTTCPTHTNLDETWSDNYNLQAASRTSSPASDSRQPGGPGVEIRLRPNSTLAIRAWSTRPGPERGFARWSKQVRTVHGFIGSMSLTVRYPRSNNLSGFQKDVGVIAPLGDQARPVTGSARVAKDIGMGSLIPTPTTTAWTNYRATCSRTPPATLQTPGQNATSVLGPSLKLEGSASEGRRTTAFRCCTSGQDFCLDSAPIAEQPCEFVPLPLRNVPSHPSADVSRATQIRPGYFAGAKKDLRCPVTPIATSSTSPTIPFLICTAYTPRTIVIIGPN
ncbi:hypothetical protein P171DRAFT_474720 [Karstenula rhodostoma CBS 690.94]|uniref:Uncharacterized protein n=1 Tax=Karstenula rhodostoma CBS 690.94 TaxID=1392251 RepID=A0A9P4PEB8_9PLEO|nr:hypothetical protein P171DRAFT_474720 [Karstenula rhodostoma CBS 690.94]